MTSLSRNKGPRGLMARALLSPQGETPLKFSGRFEPRTPSIEEISETDLTSEDRVTSSNLKVTSQTLDFMASTNLNSMTSSTQNALTTLNINSMTSSIILNNPSIVVNDVTIESPRKSDLKTIKEEESRSFFDSTQQLRSGFFRTIKRQYPALGDVTSGFGDVTHGGDVSTDSGRGESDESLHQDNDSVFESPEHKSTLDGDEELPFMTSMAKRRLRELRKVDPNKVDVATGLQWIRLELHEMREQDKSLFLQLIKLHSTIKDVRAEFNCSEMESNDCSYDDINDAASLWWPRYSTATSVPEFSSSDGAQLLSRYRRPGLRRGFSLNYPRTPTNYEQVGSCRSLSGRPTTAC